MTARRGQMRQAAGGAVLAFMGCTGDSVQGGGAQADGAGRPSPARHVAALLCPLKQSRYYSVPLVSKHPRRRSNDLHPCKGEEIRRLSSTRAFLTSQEKRKRAPRTCKATAPHEKHAGTTHRAISSCGQTINLRHKLCIDGLRRQNHHSQSSAKLARVADSDLFGFIIAKQYLL
jgi:hypothetical protein